MGKKSTYQDKTEKQTHSTRKVDFDNPPEGYQYVPVPIEEYMINEWELDPRYITIRKIGSRTHLVYMQLWTEKEAKEYIQNLKNESNREDRSMRCIIESPKTGKAIRCPDNRSCYHCPLNGSLVQEFGMSLSVEQLSDDGIELEAHTCVEDAAIADYLKLEILAELANINQKLASIFELLIKEKAPKEISEELGIKQSTLYDDIAKIRKIAKKLLE